MQTETKIYTSGSGYDLTPLTHEEISKLALTLTDEERRVMLDHGTEAAFCGTLLDNKLDGTYACRLCGLPLFSSKHKFNSGTGWPSFYGPFDKDHLKNIEDNSYGMRRIEIRCRPLREPPGTCVPRWPAADRTAILSQLRLARVFEEGKDIPQKS